MSGDITVGAGGRGQTAQLQEYAAFKVEQRGIDLIPDAERKMKPSGLFWLWAGAVFNVEFFFYGTLIMLFGLSVARPSSPSASATSSTRCSGGRACKARRPARPRS